MDSYTQAELDALAAVTNAATAGPWQEFAESGEYWLAQVEENGEPGELVIADTHTSTVSRQEDIDFIVAARTAMPRLLATARVLGQVRPLLAEFVEPAGWIEYLEYGGGSSCIHCGADAEERTTHVADCPILAARALLDQIGWPPANPAPVEVAPAPVAPTPIEEYQTFEGIDHRINAGYRDE